MKITEFQGIQFNVALNHTLGIDRVGYINFKSCFNEEQR